MAPSKAWQVFGKIQNEVGEEIEGYVACRTCFGVSKLNSKSTSNLIKHKCVKNITNAKVQIQNSHKDEIKNKVTEWCIKDLIPFAKVEGAGFIAMLEQITSIAQTYSGPIDISHIMPHPTTAQ